MYARTHIVAVLFSGRLMCTGAMRQAPQGPSWSSGRPRFCLSTPPSSPCLTFLTRHPNPQLAADAEELEVRVATRLAAAAEENPPAGPDQVRTGCS